MKGLTAAHIKSTVVLLGIQRNTQGFNRSYTHVVQLKRTDMNLSRSDQGQMHVNIYFIVLFYTSSEALLELVREGFTQAWNPFVHVSDILMHC